jgi:hypothetical protein
VARPRQPAGAPRRAGDGGPGLRPGPRHRVGDHAGRHEAVPVRRSGPAAVRGALAVGQQPVRWLGHPSDHRLPVADRPVVLGARAPRSAGLGRATAVGRVALPRRRHGRVVVRPPARSEPPRWLGGRARLPAVAVRPAVRLTDVRAAVAVGGARLARRLDDPGRTSRRLALPGHLRPRRRDRGRHQRDRHRPHRSRSSPVARQRRAAHEGDPLAAGAGRRRPTRRALVLRVAVVARGAPGAVPLRRGRARVLGDDPGRLVDVARLRGHARPRLLAVLRRRRHRVVDGRLHPVRAVALADRPRLPAGRRRPARDPAGAMA